MRPRTLMTLIALGLIGCDAAEEADPVGSLERGLTAEAAPGLTLVATLEAGVGPDEVTLRPPAREVLAGGPSALAVGADGVIAVADTLGGRVVRLGADGSPLPPLAAPDVEDVAFDAAGQLQTFSRHRSRIATFDEGGQAVEVVEVPRRLRWITGFCPWPGGLGLRTAYQESLDLSAQGSWRDRVEGVPGLDGAFYRTSRREGLARVERLAADGEEGRAVVERRLTVEVATPVGSLTLVGVTAEGELVLDVQDVTQPGGGPLRVSRRLLRLGPEGEARGEVAVPRSVAVPVHALALGLDGQVYALQNLVDRTLIWRWSTGDGGAR